MIGTSPPHKADSAKEDDPDYSIESYDAEVVILQIEQEKDNEIQFRTCSWQKLSNCVGSSRLDASILIV